MSQSKNNKILSYVVFALVILSLLAWLTVILMDESERAKYEVTKTDSIFVTVTDKEIDFGTTKVNSAVDVPMRDVNYYLFFGDIKYLVDQQTYEKYDIGDTIAGTLTYTYDFRQPNIHLNEKWRIINE